MVLELLLVPGLEVVELVLLLLLAPPEAGVEVTVLFVVELLLLLFSEAPPAGFTTVVLFSVFFSGVAGATVSVFCSQPIRRAALARIRIYFFIVLQWVPIMG